MAKEAKKEEMQKKELERRAYNFEIRAEETEQGNIITGRPIVYNSRTDLGWFDEEIDPHIKMKNS